MHKAGTSRGLAGSSCLLAAILSFSGCEVKEQPARVPYPTGEEDPAVTSPAAETAPPPTAQPLHEAPPPLDRASLTPPAPPGVTKPAGEWKLIWQDEFEGGAIDPARWSRVVAGGGFGNNERQFYTDSPRNAFVENGCLVIQALEEEREGHPYTSAKLHTQGKGDWTYGRIEIRAKLPEGQGIWPAIWMMPTEYGAHGTWPVSGEIDIVELIGSNPGTVHGTLHYGDPWKNTGGHYSLPGGRKFSDDFHVFGFEWLPGLMRWFVDGQVYLTQDDWYTSWPGAMWPAPFDKRFYLQFNIAVGGNWPRYPDETTKFPQRMHVDYVRVYQFTGDYPTAPKRSAAPPQDRKRPALPDGNLIYNGGFDQGVEEWSLNQLEGAAATMQAGEGRLQVNVSRPGPTPAAIEVVQQPLNIEQGKVYEIAFDAGSDQPRGISVFVGKASQHWDVYSGLRTFKADAEVTRHTLRFKMRTPTDPVARLVLQVGNREGGISIDNVRVSESEADAPYVVDGPLKIEAEAFDDAQGVETQPCHVGGLNVGWIEADDWLAYQLEVTSPGVYEVTLRFSNGGKSAGQAALEIDDAVAATFSLPVTGDWQIWQSSSQNVQLTAGSHRLRVSCTGSGYNLQWISLRPVGAR